MAEITHALDIDSQAKNTTWGTLFKPESRKKVAITAMLGFYSHWVGNSVVSYYLTLVLDTVGVTDPTTQTLIKGLLQLFNLCATVCAGLLVDKLGRRTLWNRSGIGMLISFVIWTACSARFALSENPSSGLGCAVIIFIFICFFHYDIAYTPLVLAYPTEILQYSLRSKGLSMELGILYCSLDVLSFVNPIALAAIGWKYYIVFCCVLFVLVITNWLLLPETRGRSLEEISELFEKPRVDASGEEGNVESVEETKAGAGVATHIDHIGETKS